MRGTSPSLSGPCFGLGYCCVQLVAGVEHGEDFLSAGVDRERLLTENLAAQQKGIERDHDAGPRLDLWMFPEESTTR